MFLNEDVQDSAIKCCYTYNFLQSCITQFIDKSATADSAPLFTCKVVVKHPHGTLGT